jgi:hypothetical protein
LEGEFSPHSKQHFVFQIHIEVVNDERNERVEWRWNPKNEDAQAAVLVSGDTPMDSQIEGTCLGEGVDKSRRILEVEDDLLPYLKIDNDRSRN